jgi:hypothetical protein
MLLRDDVGQSHHFSKPSVVAPNALSTGHKIQIGELHEDSSHVNLCEISLNRPLFTDVTCWRKSELADSKGKK